VHAMAARSGPARSWPRIGGVNGGDLDARSWRAPRSTVAMLLVTPGIVDTPGTRMSRVYRRVSTVTMRSRISAGESPATCWPMRFSILSAHSSRALAPRARTRSRNSRPARNRWPPGRVHPLWGPAAALVAPPWPLTVAPAARRAEAAAPGAPGRAVRAERGSRLRGKDIHLAVGSATKAYGARFWADMPAGSTSSTSSSVGSSVKVIRAWRMPGTLPSKGDVCPSRHSSSG
jgi:hypothetical protein